MYNNSTEPTPWQPSQSVRIVITAIFGSILLTGIVGNVLVITLILLVKSMRSVVNLCLASLALSDLIVLVFLPTTPIVDLYGLDQSFFGTHYCVFILSIDRGAVVCSTLIFLLIGVERYTVVCHPLKTLGFWTRTKVCLLLAVIWAIIVGVSVPFGYLVRYEQLTVHNTTSYSCYIDWDIPWAGNYEVGTIFATYFLPIPLLVAVYGKIIITLRTQVPESDTEGSGAREARRARSRVIVMMALVVVIFVVCLLPFQVITIYQVFVGDPTVGFGEGSIFAFLWCTRFFGYLNFIANPIVYFVMSENFRQAFRSVFCRCAQTPGISAAQASSTGRSRPKTSHTDI